MTMVKLPRRIKEATKIIGYFSYTEPGQVFCDGDACIIAGSSEAMTSYLESRPPNPHERNIIKKTRFGEIVDGLRRGGAYAFDEEAYARFFRCAKRNEIGVPAEEEVFQEPSAAMHFIRIQIL